MATILIPTPLRKFTSNSSRIAITGNDISEIFNNLISQYPDIQKHIVDPSGIVRPFINVFVGEDDIRSLSFQKTQVNEQSVISIVPAIAGGNLKKLNL